MIHWIWLIVVAVVSGTVATIVVCCFAANGVMYWRRMAERLEWLVAEAVKHIPTKVWREITPALQDELMQIVEKSYQGEAE